MFGRRSNETSAPRRLAPATAGPAVPAKMAEAKPAAKAGAADAAADAKAPPPPAADAMAEHKHSEQYYDVKTTVFNSLIDTIDLTQLAKLDAAAAREEIRDIVSEIIQLKSVVMSIAEQEELLEDICNDVLGYGPLDRKSTRLNSSHRH